MINRYKSDYASKLRLRIRPSKTNEILPKHYNSNKHSAKFSPPISSSHFTGAMFAMIFVFFIIVEMEKWLPTPLMLEDEVNNPGRFIAERAKNHLYNLTSMGPRPVGSVENEILAVDFLKKEINSIISKSIPLHRISIDLQKTSGAFPLEFLDGLTNVYKNVQNVIVKIGPVEESEHSMLINCHIDTVPDSPGGSDDGASCAVMLEMLQIISQSKTPLKHNIIFLFNGAEENLMQASHGFITQHAWAKSIRIFVNLEACGAGGREILFQAGPEHPWLMQAYAETVPYPLTSSVAQEIFQSGIIPADTDYRVFRDFGQISGLDFAWSSNGYVYHTKLDNIDYIPLGTLQRTGDNILPLVKRLVNSDELSNIEKYKHGNLVFFDVLGAFIIYLPEVVAGLIHYVFLSISFYTIYWNIQDSKKKGYNVTSSQYVRLMCLSSLIIILTGVVALFFTTSIALGLSALNRAMSWFSRPAWLFFLYLIPVFVTLLSSTMIFSKKIRKEVSNPWIVHRIYHDAVQLIWTIILALAIIFKIRSGILLSLWVLFLVISWVVREKVFTQWRDWRWLWAYTGILLFPFIQTGYMLLSAVQLVVPIMGRAGSGNFAEVVFSAIFSAGFFLFFTFYAPLILLVKSGKKVISFLSIVFFVSVLLLLFTPLGFPYSSDPQAPSPQRYIIVHTDRILHDENGAVRSHKSGFWIVDLDVNSPRMVRGLVPEIANAELISDDCKNELYCGLPYIIPVATFIWKTHWIPGRSPNVPVAVDLKLLKRDSPKGEIQRLSFVANGPDHMNLVLSPYPGVTLLSWSLVQGTPLAGPKWNGRDTYYVYYSCGSDPEPWNFSIDLLVSPDHKGPVVEMGIAGHRVHGAQQTTPELRNLLSQFPPWAVTSGWCATYKSYTF
ncbi:unnamed protein product [Bemisia tabaci]|uniref:FXNA-like protease n=1 Tax=Bemisia tabaci TaxID=7038 RepID=A0A9P0EVD7_BEMTA|nr:unnamed protein product [Bemisia tabaci]